MACFPQFQYWRKKKKAWYIYIYTQKHTKYTKYIQNNIYTKNIQKKRKSHPLPHTQSFIKPTWGIKHQIDGLPSKHFPFLNLLGEIWEHIVLGASTVYCFYCCVIPDIDTIPHENQGSCLHTYKSICRTPKHLLVQLAFSGTQYLHQAQHTAAFVLLARDKWHPKGIIPYFLIAQIFRILQNSISLKYMHPPTSLHLGLT